MSFKIGFNEMVKILKQYGCNDFDAPIIADYLTECIDYVFDLSDYLWNALQFNVMCFTNKADALQYIKDNLCCSIEDCTIYECEVGVYLEWR